VPPQVVSLFSWCFLLTTKFADRTKDILEWLMLVNCRNMGSKLHSSERGVDNIAMRIWAKKGKGTILNLSIDFFD
jgi:hypothetical protein